MIGGFSRRELYCRGILMVLVGMLLICAFVRPAGAQAGGEKKFKQIRLRINVLKGIPVDDALKEHLKQIVDEANKILLQADVQLVFDKNNDIGSDVEIGDGDKDIEDMGELKAASAAGKREVKERFKGKGYKVFVAGKLLDATTMGITAHRDQDPGPVDPVSVLVLNIKDATAKGRGNDLAHEVSHGLTLGAGHVIRNRPPFQPKNADGDGHDPNDKTNLMYPDNPVDPNAGAASRGTELTPEQGDEVKEGGGEISRVKTRRSDGVLVDVRNGFGFWSDDVGDVAVQGIDLLAGSVFHGEGSQDLKFDIEFDNPHPDDANSMVEVDAGFDTDNNPATGVLLGSFAGVDKVLQLRLEGAFPFVSPAGLFTADVYDPITRATTSLTPGGVVRVSGIVDVFTGPAAPYLLLLQDGLEQVFPVSLLGPLADQVPVGIRCRDPFTGEVDEASMVFEVVPAGVPSLTMSPLTWIVGQQQILSGAGFTPSSTVRLTVDNIEVSRIATTTNGSFTTALLLPAPTPGDHFVTALDDHGLYDFSILTGLSGPGSGGSGSSFSIPALSTAGLLLLLFLVALSGVAILVRK